MWIEFHSRKGEAASPDFGLLADQVLFMWLLDSPITKTPHNLISLVNMSWGHWDKMINNRGTSNLNFCSFWWHIYSFDLLRPSSAIVRWSGQCVSSVQGLLLPLGQSPAKSMNLNKLYFFSCNLGIPAPAWSSSPPRLTRRFYNWIRHRQEMRSVQIKPKPGVNLLNRRSHLLSRQCSHIFHIDGETLFAMLNELIAVAQVHRDLVVH